MKDGREVNDIILFQRVYNQAKEKLMCEAVHDVKYKSSVSSELRKMEVVSRAVFEDQGFDLGFEMRIQIMKGEE